MKDLTKKCWREKVTAEITLAHLQHFADESGNHMSAVTKPELAGAMAEFLGDA